MRKGDTVALVCCSNGLLEESRRDVDQIERQLTDLGIFVKKSPCLFQKDSVFSGSAKERAEALMAAYTDDAVQAIFDLSGGDIANEILPFLNFSVIQESRKPFWGYSDLTTILNAVYTRTGNTSVLYQVRNILGAGDTLFADSIFRDSVATGGLGTFSYRWIQGTSMEGTLVGGNIRCLLKLAGTPYFPDMKDKILLLEARSGQVAQMTAYLSQLQQMGVFEQIAGLLLGTFTQMQKELLQPDIVHLVKQQVRESLPIAKTEEIGHAITSKAVEIGGYYRFG